ncbi:MAG: FHA domain-containing protein [Verrucomicrobia bacterium]|nr:FHA domain-containing protein [Verrucomicrobiota bacterium]
MADLRLLDENGVTVKRWELGDQPVAVGRDETADVTVPDNTLSRRHFLIWREGERFLIKDLNSQNGTWVDGQRAQGVELSHNFCIVAGRTVFMFTEHNPPSGAEPKPLARIPEVAIALPAVLAGRSTPAPSHATAVPKETS